jgi:hypothetical protein
LIKPVNPRSDFEKNLDHSRLISQNDFGLPKEFRKISMEMAMVNSYEDWVNYTE